MSQLEDIVKETRASFIIAKSDGVLDSSEVIQIAVELAQKISKLANLSGSEKKSVLLHSLKKGLADSGGLDGLAIYAGLSDEVKSGFEDQLLSAASASVDLVLAAASGKLDIRKPMNWLPSCFTAIKALLPKEQKLVEDAVKFSEKIINKDASVEDVVTMVTEIEAIGPVVKKAEAAVSSAATTVATATATAAAAVKKVESVAPSAAAATAAATVKKVEATATSAVAAVAKKVETVTKKPEEKKEVKKDELVKGT
jgi:hypothetical protein